MRSIDLRKATAYLKAKVHDDVPGPEVSLPFEDSPVLRDLGNDMLVSYLVDLGDRFTYVQNRHLIENRITEDEIHEIGINNLYSVAENHLRVQPIGSIYAVFMEGNFEASVLLLDTVWDTSLCSYVQGGFVVAVPTRDVLAFGDLASQPAFAELNQVVSRLVDAGGDHFLFASLFRRNGLVWEALLA